MSTTLGSTERSHKRKRAHLSERSGGGGGVGRSGEEEEGDGWWVVGGPLLLPVDDHAENLHCR